MPVFVLCLISIFVALMVHVVVWRLVGKRRSTFLLLTIFFAVALLNPFVLSTYLNGPVAGLYVFLATLLFGLAYIITTPAFVASSPTMTILLTTEKAGDRGVCEEDIYNSIDDDQFIMHRVGELIEGQYLKETEGGFRITEAGRKYLWFFTFYSRLLGVGGKGG